jgi:hypothetical protein
MKRWLYLSREFELRNIKVPPHTQTNKGARAHRSRGQGAIKVAEFVMCCVEEIGEEAPVTEGQCTD